MQNIFICFRNCSNIFSNVKRLHIGFIVGYVSDRASNSFKAMKLVRWLQMSLYVFFGVLTLLKPSWWVFVLVLAINL